MAIATPFNTGASRERANIARPGTMSKSGTTLWIVLGTLAVVLSVAAAAALQMRKDHAIALAQIERESQSFISLSGALVGAALDRTQVTVMRASRGAQGLAIAGADPALVNVIVTDAQGNVSWDRNGAPPEPRRLSDTALLQRFAAAQDGVRFMSGSLTDVEFGKSSMAVVMRGDVLPGQFIFALIDPRFLNSLLESAQGSRGLSVILADGQMRKVAGTQIDDALYQQAAASLPTNVTTSPALRYVTDDNGTHYLATARLIPGYDLRLLTVERAADVR